MKFHQAGSNKKMLYYVRTLVMALGVLAITTTIFQIFVVRKMYISVEMRKCMAKREGYIAKIQGARVYPRTVKEIVDDFRGTQCDTDGDILQVNRTVHNVVLERCRFLIEPANADRFCDANTFLVVFIMSSPGDFEVRRAVRETWAHPRNIFHPNLIRALPERFRLAFNDSAMRERFGVRTFFVLGADARVAAMNEAVTATAASTASFDDGELRNLELSLSVSQRLSVASRLRIAAARRNRNSVLRIERGVQPAATSASPLDEAVDAESIRFGDILQAAFVDSYANLTLKVLLATKWIAARCPTARFAMKIDTDTLPNLPGLLASLIERDLSESDSAALDFPSFYSTRTNASEVESSVQHHLARLRNHTRAWPSHSYSSCSAFEHAPRNDTAGSRRVSPQLNSSAHAVPTYGLHYPAQSQLQPQYAADSNQHLTPIYISQTKTVQSDRVPRTSALRMRTRTGRLSYKYSRQRRGSTHLWNANSSSTIPGYKSRNRNSMQASTIAAHMAVHVQPQKCDKLRESTFYNRFYSPIMVGYRYGVSTVRRHGRWAVSYDMFPFGTYPDYFAGTAYVLSSVAVHEVYHLALHYRYFFGIEDAFVTGVLGSLMRARKYDDARFSPYNSRKPSACQLARGDRLTATNFQLNELISFWNELSGADLFC